MHKRDFLMSGSRVIIYGAGNTGRDVLEVLHRHGVVVTCFLDAVAAGAVRGVPILRPHDERLTPAERKETPVVVAVFNPWNYLTDITENLSSLGYGKIVSFQEFHGYFAGELGDRFWLTVLDFYEGLDSVIANGLQLWEDDKSRDIYDRTMRARLERDYLLMPLPDPLEDAYFPKDMPPLRRPDRFIDCGAFDGDTLVSLQRHYGAVESIVAFEPDTENFARLSTLVRSEGAAFAERVFLYPCGVWSSVSRLSFASDGQASRISGSGGTVIQCVCLDDAAGDFDPVMIKMDIEGAEYQALLGARGIIERSRPNLAICLYHRPEHLWQIPLLVRSWDLGYKFYLRQYCFNGFEQVMYALRD